MNAVTLVIGGLITWRVSHMLVKEAGPLMSFARLRAFLASNQKRSGGLFDLISCVYCTSMYIGLVAALWVSGDVFHKIGYALAFSAIATLIEALSANFTNTLSVVTRPTANHKVTVGVRSPSEKGNDVIGDPNPPDGFMTVDTPSSLND